MSLNGFTIQAGPAHVKLRKRIFHRFSDLLKSKYVTIFIKNISYALDKPETTDIFA